MKNLKMTLEELLEFNRERLFSMRSIIDSAISSGMVLDHTIIFSSVDIILEIAIDILLGLREVIASGGRWSQLNPELIFKEEKYDPAKNLGNLRVIRRTKRKSPLDDPELIIDLEIMIHYLVSTKRLGQRPAFHELSQLPTVSPPSRQGSPRTAPAKRRKRGKSTSSFWYYQRTRK